MLRYTLVGPDDKYLQMQVFNILNSCGLQMLEEEGLEHWFPAYSIDSICEDCSNKYVFIAWDIEKEEYVSTFQLFLTSDKTLYIRKVATHPKYYGQGFGKENMHFITTFCRKMGLSIIELDVYTRSERAINFYIANGFTISGCKTTRRFEVFLMRKYL